MEMGHVIVVVVVVEDDVCGLSCVSHGLLKFYVISDIYQILLFKKTEKYILIWPSPINQRIICVDCYLSSSLPLIIFNFHYLWSVLKFIINSRHYDLVCYIISLLAVSDIIINNSLMFLTLFIFNCHQLSFLFLIIMLYFHN